MKQKLSVYCYLKKTWNILHVTERKIMSMFRIKWIKLIIEHIPNNLIFTTKFNDSPILITIISWICRWRMQGRLNSIIDPRQNSALGHYLHNHSQE
jgi:hypothetical protein